MFRIAALLATAVVAMPAVAQMNLFSPSLLTAEDWVVATAPSAKPAKAFAHAYEAAPPAAVHAVASERKASRLPPLPALLQSALPAPEQVPAGPTLKREVSVIGTIVRIGDLVENAGVVAEVAIFRAPDLGQTGTVPARRIAEAVRAHAIIGLDLRGIDSVAVTRASRSIGAREVEAALVREVAARSGQADTRHLTVAFDHEVRTQHVEPDGDVELTVNRLSYDPRSRRFSAVVELAGSNVTRRAVFPVSGVLNETFDALVLMRAIAPGEAVKASDLAIERRPKSEFSAVAVIKPEQAAGLVARRALQPGKIIRLADLMKPEMVARNDTVTIAFEVPGIVLTTRGKAMEAGAQGDLITVLNVQSKRSVQALVTAPGRVTVSGTAARPAASTNPSNPPRNRAE